MKYLAYIKIKIYLRYFPLVVMGLNLFIFKSAVSMKLHINQFLNSWYWCAFVEEHFKKIIERDSIQSEFIHYFYTIHIILVKFVSEFYRRMSLLLHYSHYFYLTWGMARCGNILFILKQNFVRRTGGLICCL